MFDYFFFCFHKIMFVLANAKKSDNSHDVQLQDTKVSRNPIGEKLDMTLDGIAMM